MKGRLESLLLWLCFLLPVYGADEPFNLNEGGASNRFCRDLFGNQVPSSVPSAQAIQALFVEDLTVPLPSELPSSKVTEGEKGILRIQLLYPEGVPLADALNDQGVTFTFEFNTLSRRYELLLLDGDGETVLLGSIRPGETLPLLDSEIETHLVSHYVIPPGWLEQIWNTVLQEQRVTDLIDPN